MLEYPEVVTLARQLNQTVTGAVVKDVRPPTKPHKFCWFNGDPADYAPALQGSVIKGAEGFGLFVELSFDNGLRLCVNDGVNLRLIDSAAAPKDYQLLIALADGRALLLTVAMYGGIVLHRGDYENEYYVKSRQAVDLLSEDFAAYYRGLLAASSPKLSAKAFLATEQRFPGIGNGVLQDILFTAGIHPKRKLAALSEAERERLMGCVTATLQKMTAQNGRDTEKDLFGEAGGYPTLMSKNTLAAGCPRCGGAITKEAYLGGSVYYCAACQPPAAKG